MFKKVFLAKLKGLESSQNWFSPSKHVFSPGYSTETASLPKLTETDKKNKIFTFCAFLDIKSVFDAAWHPAILNGLIKKNIVLLVW